MGEVWRATDTKLNRSVAIKVLPPALANDAEYIARFEREAQTLAVLNHPNIAAIYGVEPGAIVMELVEGNPLPCPVPLATALEYARQIADGLAAAHEKGIIHRDLKPANIRVTPSGRVKILDFGLAKLAAAEPPGGNPANSPTLTMDMTRAGVIMGTAAYMAPEQARGEAVDKRADIWAFGVVLYEMLTGKPLFAAPTIADTLANVLTREPDLSEVPQEARRLVRRCLERNPEHRLRDAGDALLLVDEKAVSMPAPAAKVRGVKWLWLAAGILAMAVVVLAVLLWRRSPPAVLVHRYAVEGGNLTLSPDGRWMLSPRSANSIRLRAHNEVEWRTLPGTEGSSLPFWSPDSSTIGFFSDGKLRTISVGGSELRTLTTVEEGRGGSWRGGVKDGDIVYADGGRLFRYDLRAGRSKVLEIQIPPGSQAESPVFLPESDRFVFLLGTNRNATTYRSALSAAPGPPERFLDSGSQIQFARHPHNGGWYMFFAADATEADGRDMLAAPIDPRTGELREKPVKILSNLARSIPTGRFNFDVGDNGAIAWRPAGASLPIWRLRWFDRDGNVLSTVGDPGSFQTLALSPDEEQVATMQGFPATDIWIYNLKRGTGARVSTEPGLKTHPVWSPDGKILYYNHWTGKDYLVIRRAIQSGQVDVIHKESPSLRVQDVSPDGRYLLLTGNPSTEDGGAYLLDLSKNVPMTAERVAPASPGLRGVQYCRFTRDGRWILVSAPAGKGLAYRHPVSSAAPSSIVELPRAPFLSADGKSLFGFDGIGGGARLVTAPISAAGDVLRVGEQSRMFPIFTSTLAAANVAAVSRDGTRILAIAADPSEEAKTQVLSDWTVLLGAPR